MLREKLRGGQVESLTDAEKKYIMDNYANTSVLKIAKFLKRDANKIYKYLDENGLQAYNSKKDGQRRPLSEKKKEGYFHFDAKGNFI